MAVSVAPKTGGRVTIGNKKFRLVDVTFTGSYVVGGETITPTAVGMRRIIMVLGVVTDGAGKATAMQVVWNEATGKLQMYESAATGLPGLEKTAEAYAATSVGTLAFIGE